MSVDLDQLLNVVIENRERIARLEKALETLSQGEEFTQDHVDMAQEEALDELNEQFPDLDLEIAD